MSSEAEDFALAQLLAREEIACASRRSGPMIDLTNEQDEEEDGHHSISKVSTKKRGFDRDSTEQVENDTVCQRVYHVYLEPLFKRFSTWGTYPQC